MGVFIAAVLTIAASDALAYDSYRAFGADASCADCHPEFISKGPLHDLHVGNSQMTNTCTLCHSGVGDIPKTWTSGSGEGCRGCHGRDNGPGFTWGAGLRAHHANAGAPPDMNGQLCAACHTDPPPDPESTPPVYYLLSDVDVKDPCVAALPDGEDYDGDGKGLDNDGDLTYDGNDADCMASGIAGTPPSFSALKLSVFPNPAPNGVAVFQYELAEPSEVLIRVFDIAGRFIAEERSVGTSPGVRTYQFTGKDSHGATLATGVYVVWVKAGVFSDYRRFVIMK